ncbi:right-handed parallel beta-helix repeat-containing protein [Aureibaculum sp. 2210JD6-5]|uniref:right-handed parallel beta-helix repeat-containing protein n=1 Tax=Aureibaculum sp. 2210JD6-5 TaxID=3103957 RepID=UPI002AADE1C9|nr:right-handed parallel beta-helix repeat-containing protein [Aureibaculum sp. 2210JD6-5]MDY7396894.1 right-handed parallel beta-helix repeat-containing protein [Aureibaculum sp. 2210JD6-5]
MNKYLFYAPYLVLLFLLSSCQNEDSYFVSPDGNDTHIGTNLESPFANIQKALETIVAKRVSGSRSPSVIYLRGGHYNIKSTLKIDSTLSNITIQPYKNEKVFFNGGVSFPVDKIEHAPESRIKTVNLKALGITNYGKLRNVGFARPYGASWGEVFINKKAMHLARWPNETMIPMGKVLDKGSVPRNGDFTHNGGIIEYDSLRISNWAKEKDAWMSGYFMWGYADDMVKIAEIDTIDHTLKTASPTLYGYGDNAAWRNWYGVNILAELDEAGEYYIDKDLGKLYFITNEEDINSFEFSLLEDPFFMLQNTENVTISGITFECSRGLAIAMDNTQNVTISESVFRNLGSLGITIGKGIEPFEDYLHDGTGKPKAGILGSMQQHFYANTTFNREGGHNNKIINCEFYELGAGGVSMGGGDRLTLEAGNNTVENCVFHDLNRIEKSYRPAVHVTGVGNTIAHCEIYNTPSMAIYMYGNNHIIEYNYIHDVCLEIEDQGAFYYGRDPSELGTIVRYNYFENIPDRFATCAIYNDDGACGLTVFGNVFNKAGKWNVLLGGGSNNKYQNNIFIGNKYGIHVDNRLQNWSKAVLDDGLYQKRLDIVNYLKPPYIQQYPELETYMEKADLPTGNLVENNVFINVKQLVDGKMEWLDWKKSNLELTEDPGFENWEKHIFSLKENSEVFKKLPGFKKIPFHKIGLYDE